MKTKKSVIVLILLVVIIGVAGSLFNYNISQERTIKVSTFDLSALLTHLDNWKKWNTTLFSKNDSIIPATDGEKTQTVILQDKAILKLTVINPALFLMEQQQNNNTNAMQVITLQSSKREGFTDVHWMTQKNGFQWLKEKLAGDNSISAQLDDLKKFAESTQDLYGFPIRLIKVIDPVICTKREIVPQADIHIHNQKLLTDIRLFLKANKIAPAKNYYYVTSAPLDEGRSELGVGIPVKALPQPKDGFELLELPADGNLLIGTYEGDPSGIQKLYNAMDKYVSDKRLSKVAQPMEIHTGEPSVLNDKTNVSIQVVYPVY